MSDRDEIYKQQLQSVAADFVSLHSNRQSLITVTDAKLTDRRSTVTFYVSVFPEEAEGPAIGFLMRKRGECKQYLMDKTRNKTIPHVEFALDEGEKNRQRVDQLLNS